MQPVAIVGNYAATRIFAPFDKMEIEIWALNAHPMSVKNYPRVDLNIQIHTQRVLDARYKHHQEWLKQTRIPALMCKKFEAFTTSIPYPFEQVFDLVSNVTQGMFQQKPLKFLTFSIDYALAYAILQKRPKIFIYGVDLIQKNTWITGPVSAFGWVLQPGAG